MILAIDTSTPVCSVALHEEGRLLTSVESHLPQVHGKVLVSFIDHVCREAGIRKRDLQAVAVANGPGSYTGLRIGLSTAKGLCYALDLPLITLDALAGYRSAFSGISAGTLIAMMDARRMEAYVRIEQLGDLAKVLQESSPQILDENLLAPYLDKGPIFLVGDAVAKFMAAFPHAQALPVRIGQSARLLGAGAWEAFGQKAFADLAYAEPNYLKAFLVTASKKNPFQL
ncbi:MAG: tRNA (adenosine(37)-N6)-threonylcarbamoyltransferase complex dimerization subunit type 1 TsaB [Nitritalea sp.]